MKKRLQQRWFLNLGLLAVATVLFSFIYFGEEPGETGLQRVSDYLPRDINHIRIVRPGKKTISFQLKDNNWLMTEPHAMRADRNMIERLMAITRLRISHTIDSDAVREEDIGLITPEAMVTFNDIPITFGDPQPIGEQRYIKLGKQIMLVADQHVSQLKTGSIAYIDRQLVPLGSSIVRLTIAGREIDIKSGSGIVDQWLGIKASWLSQSPGIPVNAAEIHITLQDSSIIHYLAERRDNDAVLTNPEIQLEYHLPLHALDTLALTLPDNDRDASGSDKSGPTQ